MAPDFVLPATSGQAVRLYDCKNRKTALLFFFDDKDRSCLDRLSSIAGNYQQFLEKGAIIFPITILPLAEAKQLAEGLALPFPILCDQDHSVVRNYRVGQCSHETHHVCFEVITKVTDPQVLIVDTSGIIRFKHSLCQPGAGPDSETLVKECEQALK
jgi:peroxiredoxin Q/BCP